MAARRTRCGANRFVWGAALLFGVLLVAFPGRALLAAALATLAGGL